MLYYHTEAQRQMIREHVEQLARDMRRNTDATTPDVGRDRRTFPGHALPAPARRVRAAWLRAHLYHG